MEAEHQRDDISAGTPETFFMRYMISRAASKKCWRTLILDISVAVVHARTGQEIDGATPRDVRSSRYWRLKASTNGTRKASAQWQYF